MKPSRPTVSLVLAALTALGGFSASSAAFAQASAGGIDISQQPLFTQTAQPPLNMLVMGRDHKLYYEAYNDASDLNGDGVLDVGYKPAQIDYYGYFDSRRCYTYSTSNNRFTPGTAAPNKTCSGAWSGDFLNYLTTSRMDALRKVFYGGYRVVDTNADTVLERSHVPQDAHSWGKEYTSTAVDGYDIAKYTPLAQPQTGRKHLFANTTLVNSESSGPLLRVLQNSPFRIWNWVSIERPVAGDDCFINGSSTRVNCLTGGGAAGGTSAWEFVPATAFTGLTRETWRTPTSQASPATLAAMNTMFGTGSNGYATNTYRCGSGSVANINGSGNPFSGTNSCTNDNYMTRFTGTLTVPVTGSYKFAIDGDDAVDFSISGPGITTQNIGFYNAHSVCNCQTNAGAAITLTAGVAYTITYRHKEDGGDDYYRLYWLQPNSVASTRQDYVARVEVCKTGLLESNCKVYPNGNRKPTGILHDYGETDRMYFGLMTGTYAKNTQGGVIRSNMGSFTRELDLNTGIFRSTVTDGIVYTINKLRTIEFRGSSYDYSCGWITTRPVDDGECSMWGNPIGEMMYETLRYFGGAASPRTEYNIGTGDKDALTPLSLARPAWKSPYKAVSDGGSGYLACSAPAMTVVSDINPSYDWSLPGSNWGAISAGSDPAPLNTLNVGTQVDAIWAAEGGGSKSVFIGEAGGVADGAPTVKTVSNLSTVRGLAPEEPSKQGTYYSAGVARFGALNKIGGDQRVQTYSVALASPLPRIDFPVGNGRITLVPFAKSVAGSSISATSNFQPTDQIVDYYVQKIANTDANGSDSDATVNGGRPYAEFRINFEDVEQGADHDMDAIALYTLAVDAQGKLSVTVKSEYAAGGIDQHMGYVISGTTSDGIYLEACDLGDGKVNDGTRSSCAGQVYYKLNTPPGRAPGFCNTSSTECTGLPPTNTRLFTPGSTAGAGLLKDPLWYAAKYGTPAGLPSLDDDGQPLNYFLVTNALGLRAQLDQAFQNIIANSLPSASVATSSPRYTPGSTLAYEVSYNSDDWTGDVRAYKLSTEGTYAGGIPVWSASARMPAHASRKIYSAKRNGTNEDGSSFVGTVFKNDSISTKQRALIATSLIPAVGTAVDESLINYLRGDKTKEQGQTGCTTSTCPYRKRSTKIGDIINSTPTVSGVTSYGYSLLPPAIAGAAAVSGYEAYVAGKKTIYGSTNANPILFVGSNDGMLHAIDGRDGSAGGVELFSYIPYAVLGNVSELARPAYTHRYFVDGTPTIADAYLSNGWKTVLASSVGAGGKGVFALDITDPRNFSESKVLWEFNSAVDTDMGNFVGRPSIGLTQEGKWVAVFGNGYNGASQRAILHIRDLATGTQIAKIDTLVGCSRLLTACTTGPNGLATATLVDNTGDGVGDTIYAGDYLGNLWRFDQASNGTWSVGNSNKPIFVAKDGTGSSAKVQSITSGIYTVAHPLGGTMVIFGTGRYLNADDADDATLGFGTRASVDTVYGIWDATRIWNAETGAWTTTATSSTGTSVNLSTLMVVNGRADLQPQSFISYTPLADDGTGGYRTGTRNPVEFRTPDSPGTSASPRYMGWYVDLKLMSGTGSSARNLLAGERVTATPQGILNDVVVNTFRPSGNSCKPGAQNATLVFDALTGGASFTPIVPNGGWPAGQTPPSGAIAGTDTGIIPPSGEPPVIVIRPTTPPVPCLPGAPGCDDTPALNDVKSCSWRSPNAADRTPGKLIPCGRISWKQLR